MQTDRTELALLTVRGRRHEFRKRAQAQLTLAETVLAQICVLAVFGVLLVTVGCMAILYATAASAIYFIAIGSVGATMSLLMAACARALLYRMLGNGGCSDRQLVRSIRGAFAFLLLRAAVLSVLAAAMSMLASILARLAIMPIALALAALSALLWYQGFFAAEHIFENEDISFFRAVALSFSVTRGRRSELLVFRISCLLRAAFAVLSLGAAVGRCAALNLKLSNEYSRYYIALYSALKGDTEVYGKALSDK